jgi:Ca2+-binding RTX toxin-like protein
MPVIPVTRNITQFSANTPAQTLNAGDTLNLSANASIYALGTGDGAHGILAHGPSVMNLAGGVYSREASAVSTDTGGNTISIVATGSLYGFIHGLRLGEGNNTVTNAGRISGGDNIGLFIGGAGSNVVINSGAISSGGSSGVSMYGSGNSLNNSGTIEVSGSQAVTMGGGSIHNSGTIQGGSGIGLNGAGTVTNTGNILAGAGAGFNGDPAVQKVFNSGLIQTVHTVAISLGSGNDVYDGHDGGRVVGEVRGGDDNDTLLGGGFVDVFRGEDDNDVLNGGGGADFLDGGFGNDTYELGGDSSDTIGDASGIDTVSSTITRSLTWGFIENLILQGAANINGTGNALNNSLVGNGMNNLLAGQAGNDVLLGGGGNDQLFGQADKDNLTGGAGNDKFGFQAIAHTAAGLGDVIVDLDDNGDDVMDFTGIIPGVLTFIGQAAFTAANQVRYQQVGANVLVQINTAGASGAEGEITLLNTTIGNGAVGQVNAADFML